MCGIAGFLAKRDDIDVAAGLTAMLNALHGRGPDSTGVSLYGAPHPGNTVASVWCGEATVSDPVDEVLGAMRAAGEVVSADERSGYLRVGLRLPDLEPATLGAVADAVETAAPGVRVFSMGNSLELVKHTSAAPQLAETFGLLGRPYTHAIGHARMATESIVDVNHSHPFWARPFADVTVAHNGHVTNYYKNRRLYEMRGHRFQTGNDTEFVAVYLADKLARGVSLDDAVRASIDELDGSFTYLVSTAEGFGVARDRFSTKPCLIAETDDWVAVVSEGIALAEAFGDDVDFKVTELPGGEARAWSHHRGAPERVAA
jgi:glutamate synthase domain-containing protein 1